MLPRADMRNVSLQEKQKDIFFNPRNSRKIVKFICCLDYFQTPKALKYLNILYILFTYAIQITTVLQGLICTYTAPKIADKVEAIHYTLVIVIIFGYITNELVHYSSVNEAWVILRYAFDHFNGDRHTEEQRAVHARNSATVQLMNKWFTGLMTLSALGYLCFAPIREAIYEDPAAPRSLPIPIYVPYDATHNPGYVLTVLWEGVTLFYLVGVATSANQSYITYMGTLRAELRLLNHSVLHTEERALRKYGGGGVGDTVYDDPRFQECMCQCLREDIIHHQLLLRFYNLTKSYLGFILLMFIVVASIVLAAAGYLLTRPNSPLDETIKFVVIVCSEMVFILNLCWYGDSVAEESTKIFHNLFQGPWYKCNKEFKKNLDIMMCGTIRPMQLKTNVFNITASLVTYNSVVTTSFQYFNLLRNVQTL